MLRRASGQQGEEQAGAHARLQHVAAGEAEALGCSPKSTDDRLGRVVGVLRRPLQGGVFGRGHRVGEILADRLPAGPKLRGARQREGVLRQFRCPEADEA